MTTGEVGAIMEGDCVLTCGSTISAAGAGLDVSGFEFDNSRNAAWMGLHGLIFAGGGLAGVPAAGAMPDVAGDWPAGTLFEGEDCSGLAFAGGPSTSIGRAKTDVPLVGNAAGAAAGAGLEYETGGPTTAPTAPPTGPTAGEVAAPVDGNTDVFTVGTPTTPGAAYVFGTVAELGKVTELGELYGFPTVAVLGNVAALDPATVPEELENGNFSTGVGAVAELLAVCPTEVIGRIAGVVDPAATPLGAFQSTDPCTGS